MKCALEMLKIQQETRKLWALEQERKDEECRKEHLQIIENTILFCETYVQEELEKQARKLTDEPNLIAISFRAKQKSDRLDHCLFSRLYADGRIYADGTRSYSVEDTIYDLEILTKFLEEHCFTVEVSSDGYCHYGSGLQSGIKIEVSIKI